MSYAPTVFRALARGGWGGRAASHFRDALSVGVPDIGLPIENPQTLGQTFWGQIGTVGYRMQGAAVNASLTGITRDSAGAALGNCVVELYHGKRMIAGTTSDGSGNFRFDNPGSGPFRVISDKAGVAGVSAETLTAV